MRKVEILTTRDCEDGYGTAPNTACIKSSSMICFKNNFQFFILSYHVYLRSLFPLRMLCLYFYRQSVHHVKVTACHLWHTCGGLPTSSLFQDFQVVFVPRNFKGRIGSIFDSCVSRYGTTPIQTVTYGVEILYLKIWHDHLAGSAKFIIAICFAAR